MHLSKIKTLAIALVITAAANAQLTPPPDNARMRAMSGGPAADISNVFRYPVLMMGYNDHLQATFDPASPYDAGGFIGVKPLSDVISVGILANQGYMASTARNAMLDDGITGASSNAEYNNGYNIPHLLLGFDLGVLQLGADIFFEYSGYSTETKAATNSHTNWHVMHPGARLSVAVDLGVTVLAKFGIGLPSFGGEVKNGDNTDKFESESGLYMEVGAEVGANFLDIDWTVGLEYASGSYQIDEDGPENADSRFQLYIGGEFNVLETAVATAQYSFTRVAGTTDTTIGNDNNYVMNGNHTHAFRVGMENIWDNVWVFDAVALRGGASYEISYNVSESNNEATNVETDTWQPGVHTAVVPTLGFGVSKSFFTLDLALYMSQWDGAFVGPPVALATATIKF